MFATSSARRPTENFSRATVPTLREFSPALNESALGGERIHLLRSTDRRSFHWPRRSRRRAFLEAAYDGFEFVAREFGLQGFIASATILGMSVHEIAEAVMELSETERLDLARRIVASVVAEQGSAAEVARAVQGIEDVLTGKVRGLSEAQFQRALR